MDVAKVGGEEDVSSITSDGHGDDGEGVLFKFRGKRGRKRLKSVPVAVRLACRVCFCFHSLSLPPSLLLSSSSAALVSCAVDHGLLQGSTQGNDWGHDS